MSERFIDELKAGQAHPAQPSMMKYAGTELNKARHELVMAAGGSNALEWESDRSRGGKAAREWLGPRPIRSKAAPARSARHHRQGAHIAAAGGVGGSPPTTVRFERSREAVRARACLDFDSTRTD
jgi:hypothetical protein